MHQTKDKEKSKHVEDLSLQMLLFVLEVWKENGVQFIRAAKSWEEMMRPYLVTCPTNLCNPYGSAKNTKSSESSTEQETTQTSVKDATS